VSAGSTAVTVVGSCNEDITVAVDVLPQPGQTVLGGAARRSPGGKGANQAVAAARLGCAVELVGRVGDDDTGRRLRAALDAEGVGTAALRTTTDAPSGLAMIAVDADGENMIVVGPGANALVAADDVERALATAAADSVNPAPARPVPTDLLRRIDVLVPNRTELGVLSDAPTPRDRAGVEALALRVEGVRALVVTLGADGALVVDGGRITHVPAPQVTVVDTTGAGDAFCAALADAVARGHSVVDAARWAVRVASVTTTAWGAQTAPTRAAVLDGDTAGAPFPYPGRGRSQG